MNKSIVLAWTLLIGLGLAASAPAEPSLEELAQLPAVGPLGGEAVTTIEEYVDHWMGKLAAAKTTEQLDKAHRKLMQGYEANPSRYYQLGYARVMANSVVAVLSAKLETMPQAKQATAAIAVASMSQITIQPALEVMAKHDNAAVRYWAAKGYRLCGGLLLAQGGQYARKMLATLERLGLEDESALVVAAVLRTASGYGEVNDDSAKGLKDVLDKVWLARCQQVHQGQVEMVEAYSKAVSFPRTATQAEQKLVLQLLADAMEAASLAYKESQKQEGPLGQAYAELMIRIEDRLADITGTGPRPVEAALENEEDTVDTRA